MDVSYWFLQHRPNCRNRIFYDMKIEISVLSLKQQPYTCARVCVCVCVCVCVQARRNRGVGITLRCTLKFKICASQGVHTIKSAPHKFFSCPPSSYNSLLISYNSFLSSCNSMCPYPVCL